MKKFKNLLCLLTAVFMLSGTFTGVFAEEPTLRGSGTEEDPYLIGTADELKAFRDLVNAETSSAKCARLTDDIDLQNEAWVPIYPASGYVTEAYAGIFDGDNHTVKGLSINAGTAYQGLFGQINGAVVKNLTVEGNVQSAKAYVGGIVGKVQQGTVENCCFSGTATTTATGSSAYAGGITGYAGNSKTQTANITGCVNMGNVNGDVSGGIVGYAKYAAITDCYNTGAISGGKRCGGIAGQLQNDCTVLNCYNIGALSGASATKADICDFLYSSSSLTNCYYLTASSGAGTGTAENCVPIDQTDESKAALLLGLGNAYTADSADINDGYPILSWQSGSAIIEKNPHIEIIGAGTLNMTNNGIAPQTTLSVNYVDMEGTTAVAWEIKSGSDVISLESPDDADETNRSVIVKAVKAGKAAVSAATVDGEYSAEYEISVFPYITTVQTEGITAVGQTIRAKVNTLGGDEYDYESFPALKYQWKYLTDEDYMLGNTSAYKNISGAESRELTITDDLEDCYISFSVWVDGENKTPGSPAKVISAAEYGITEAKLAELINSFGSYYTMYPVCGTDTNVIDVLKSEIAKRSDDEFGVSIKASEEVYGGAEIAENGDITYFYADPDSVPAIRNGRYNVTFELEYGGICAELKVPVVLCWDTERVKAVMREEIADKVSVDTENALTEDISLPKVIDNKKWTQIEWTSSNENVISISSRNQQTADTLFDPFVGVIKRGENDENVALTAVFTFMYTNGMTEEPITLNRVFNVTVKARDIDPTEIIKKQLEEKLNAGFEKKGLRDAVTGELLEEADGVYMAYNDIQFPTTRDFELDGKYYPVTITSDNDELIRTPAAANAARTEVFRPAAGKDNAAAAITVTITDTENKVAVSKQLDIVVPALTQAEIDREAALMERVISAYFDGIKGENTDKDKIDKNLSPFFEVYENEQGELVWVRSNADTVNRGIVPTALNGWSELELWRLFRSSNPDAISHENLLVTVGENAKAVTISSALSSEALGKYGELYKSDPEKYADYAPLAGLYYREVSAELIVAGESSNPPVDEKISVTFALKTNDNTLIQAVSYEELDETTTVFDVLKTALTENGYTFENRGGYIASVTTPDGITYAEKGTDGWKYSVNGKLPSVYMHQCSLKDGDEIVVFYTGNHVENAVISLGHKYIVSAVADAELFIAVYDGDRLLSVQRYSVPAGTSEFGMTDNSKAFLWDNMCPLCDACLGI